jgi:predicted site-specific integrase-resolvase
VPITIGGKRYYRTEEALKRIGISRATWFRWIKHKKIQDVKHKDVRGWRLFSEQDIRRIREFANTIHVEAE